MPRPDQTTPGFTTTQRCVPLPRPGSAQLSRCVTRPSLAHAYPPVTLPPPYSPERGPCAPIRGYTIAGRYPSSPRPYLATPYRHAAGRHITLPALDRAAECNAATGRCRTAPTPCPADHGDAQTGRFVTVPPPSLALPHRGGAKPATTRLADRRISATGSKTIKNHNLRPAKVRRFRAGPAGGIGNDTPGGPSRTAEADATRGGAIPQLPAAEPCRHQSELNNTPATRGRAGHRITRAIPNPAMRCRNGA